MHKTFLRVLTALPAVALQVLAIYAVYTWLSPYSTTINIVLEVLAILLVLFILMKRDEPSYKTLWLMVILAFPVAGALLYLLFGNKRTMRPLARRLDKVTPKVKANNDEIMGILNEQSPRLAQTFQYLYNKTGYPVMENEGAKYYPLGDDMFPDMLEDLRNAEKYIYVEYFIINHGLMFDSIVDILKEKAAAGVDVRLMYDDIGSISTFSTHEQLKLLKSGIRCVAFNPVLAIGGTLNYRDHKKMLIIDGKIAYTGGINLADEYINHIERFGHWKDIGFRITGKPVACFIEMFLQFWNAFAERQAEEAIFELPDYTPEEQNARVPDGYVLSFCNSPLSDESVSNSLYIDILSLASNYVWFYTPYLTPGSELQEAMIRAAERGVDVRIIMPGIPDKKLIFRMSRSYYKTLMDGGVKIYEYTPGFVHAKACLADDIVGTVGTVNLDYRSLFLHFENNSLFYDASLLKDLKADFIDSMDKSVQQTPNNRRPRRLLDGILRIFAPLC